MSTPTADDPIYYALSGNLDNPAIPGFDPASASDVLYVTNGETTDYAHASAARWPGHPSSTRAATAAGSSSPTTRRWSRREFEQQPAVRARRREVGADPANPVSHLGITTKPFYLKSDDTYKAGQPRPDFTFATSYGDPQEVRVRAAASAPSRCSTRSTAAPCRPGRRRSGTAASVRRRRPSTTTSCAAGDRHQPGRHVKVWFTGGGQTSDSFTYRAE